jgi:Domain of unknown function (DUF3805)
MTKNSIKSYISKNKWYSIEYPVDWSIDDDDDCVSFYKEPDGVGALQVSAYETNTFENAKASIIEHLNEQEITNHTDILEFQVDGNSFASSTFTQGNDFQQLWIITKGTKLILVTYICESDDMNIEKDERMSIIETIRIF